jgi:flagellar basal-body rod protein FlgB
MTGRIRPVLFDTTQAALEATIAGASQRQQALAANLANANTPGYQRVDVDFHSTLAAALGDGNGDAGSRLQHATFATETDASGATRADGSTVDVDSESAKIAENALEHQAAVQVAHARIGILRAAMGLGG